MTGEVIEVCQDCGTLIEPVDVPGPDGKRYRITICRSDDLGVQCREAVAAWDRAAWLACDQSAAHLRLRYDVIFGLRVNANSTALGLVPPVF